MLKNIDAAIIMAGGGGTRLWPLSVASNPKFLLKVKEHKTLFELTCERTGLPDEKIYVITNEKQVDKLKQIKENLNYISEPLMKNTGAAIAYASLVVRERHGDCTVVVLPADHIIEPAVEFRNTIDMAGEIARKGYIVTCGIKPDFPATGFGYIQKGEEISNKVFKVKRFCEKPDFETARHFLTSGEYFWNAGIFIFNISVVAGEYLKHAPQIFGPLSSIFVQHHSVDIDEISKIYSQLPDISFDYAIMEKTDKVAVVLSEFSWNDIGSYQALYDISEKDNNGNVIKGKVVSVNTRNCYINSTSDLIAVIGLENLVIAENNGAILILPKNYCQDVKKIVEILKKNEDLKNYT